MGVGGHPHGRTIVLTSKYAMQYYYVLARKGSECHRYYVQLDPESADILHDSLEQRYDLVQVCDVPDNTVEPELLITPAP
jgi:hypothetical protein